ncbi:molybdopterin molybdotransferase MoeA [Roseinatronobacter bogoriensis]|uniref:Molybdopterin molybdenumtransferase n=1 Tax=Roseinatronobacter bogoriensis subsp. barguzinensis TaxID=441209 RepID=A0A2K8K4T2_9RHOB|nr:MULTISPECIES: gephyrin-like molybdotransferase Glp [Rhodobaca]ATX64474.1 molybdopterin molybdenumtransferase MoeA [Rhodobaca barguzinensis]MBB4209180.1 molybdopterin molybdotransferase [Rhodobaca bogoriensis DSM 18756]TDW36291.1 molybdopterin molybdotransferase [Rhodobaca barguzinensis]TDY67580.1 molybdopterin molybdochelatase [Rhodobaca bogoriensis DSM 18756]
MTLHRPVHRPDPAICGCDGAAGLVPVDTARARALAMVTRLSEVEEVALADATGRALARDCLAPVALPLFDNAAMDGYALRLGDLRGPGPWGLPVAGSIRAGDAPVVLPPRQAIRILTGAPVPAGADAVIAQEQVARTGNMVGIEKAPALGQHIRRRGDDLVEGAPLLAAGRAIGPREAALLAGSGIGALPVARRLRVAILCSGSELVAPGKALAPGQIWDANHAMLASALTRPWIQRIALPSCADTPSALRDAVQHAASQADIVITTGGVSVGDEDHMAQVIIDLGGRIEVMKLAMKPGKPLSIGKLGNVLWLGLPGNPVAAYVTWHVIGQALAGKMAGFAQNEPQKSLAALAAPIRHTPGRCEFRPARLLGYDARGVQQVSCMEQTGSHRIAQLSQADALVMIPAELEQMNAGELVEILPL